MCDMAFHDNADPEMGLYAQQECQTSLEVAEDEKSPDPVPNTSPEIKALERLPWVDRLLALWILVAMIIGITLGKTIPDISEKLERGVFVGTPVPIAVGLLVMMFPILCKVQYEKLWDLFQDRQLWVQLGFSLVINWLIAPLFMLGLAWAFIPGNGLSDLRDGLVLVGIARCIAMVLVWTSLSGGDGDYCAILVGVNSILQIVLFAPLAVLYVNVISRSDERFQVDYDEIAQSVAAFLGIPLAAALVARLALRRGKYKNFYDTKFIPFVSPLSLIGLVFTIIILFAAQSESVSRSVISIVRVAAPLIVYFAVIFSVTFKIALRWGYETAVTQAFTAASNNFELAIAVSVSAYGSDSQQAVATTVGVLVEVPVMVLLVYIVRVGRGRWW